MGGFRFAQLFCSVGGTGDLFFFELVNSSLNVDKLLLTSKEWVAFGTDFDLNGADSGSSGKFVTAGTRNLAFGVVFWMDVSFHEVDFNIKSVISP